MMLPKRRIALAVGAVVLVVGVVAGREKPALEIIETRAPAARTAQADDGIDLSKLRRNEGTLPQNDPFARANTTPAEAKKTVAVVENKPVAPALPFRYFGKLIENGKTEVYVMRGDEVISIAAGQTLGEYRVEQVEPAQIAFTYLPLKTKQTLDIQ